MKTKVCTKCKRKKSLKDFHRDKYHRDGYCTWCKVCRRAYTAKWRRANKEHVLRYSKNYYHANPKRANEMNRRCNIKRKFGLTSEQYDIMFKNQGGCCAICEQPQSKLSRTLAVDHNRKTKQIRGLLCNRCNMSLGGFDHNPERLEKAAVYVRLYQKNS